MANATPQQRPWDGLARIVAYLLLTVAFAVLAGAAWPTSNHVELPEPLTIGVDSKRPIDTVRFIASGETLAVILFSDAPAPGEVGRLPESSSDACQQSLSDFLVGDYACQLHDYRQGVLKIQLEDLGLASREQFAEHFQDQGSPPDTFQVRNYTSTYRTASILQDWIAPDSALPSGRKEELRFLLELRRPLLREAANSREIQISMPRILGIEANTIIEVFSAPQLSKYVDWQGIVPLNRQVFGQNKATYYQWTYAGFTQPAIARGTDPEAIDWAGARQFLAGISAGIAGAFFVALVTEALDRRRRKG